MIIQTTSSNSYEMDWEELDEVIDEIESRGLEEVIDYFWWIPNRREYYVKP